MIEPRPTSAPREPYIARQPSDAEHDWYCGLADTIAAQMARVLAKDEMRLGVAHRYLAAAHISALVEGAGPESAVNFLNKLLSDLGVA